MKDRNEEMSLTELAEVQAYRRQKMAEARQRVAERKARTSRLIKRGAYVESCIENADKMTQKEFEEFINKKILG